MILCLDGEGQVEVVVDSKKLLDFKKELPFCFRKYWAMLSFGRMQSYLKYVAKSEENDGCENTII